MRIEHFMPTKEEYLALKNEDDCIREILGVDKKETISPSDSTSSITEDYVSLGNEIIENKLNSEKDILISMNLVEGETKQLDEDGLRELHERFNYYNLPPSLQKLLPAVNHPLPYDYAVPNDKKPEWFNMKKFKKGQAFTKKYFIGLNGSDLLSTIVLFTFPDILEALIYTENSGTPFTAFRRYLNTALKVTSWYDNDIWKKDNPGYRNLRTVRALHLNVSTRLNSTRYKDLENKISLIESSEKPDIWSDQREILLKDFQFSCPFKSAKPFDNKRPGKVFINQLDMSITQFAFVGLMVTYPEKFGAASATKEEKEGFLHMWRSIGYLLGIKDEYNFCNGSLEEVLERCHAVINHWVRPNLQHVTEDWEHMSRCLVEGTSYYLPSSLVVFEPIMVYLCWVVDVQTPRLYKSLSWYQTCVYYIIKVTLTFTLRLPGMLPIHNWLLRFALARASTMSPEDLEELKSKEYDYQMKRRIQVKEPENKTPRASLLALIYVARLLA